MRGLLLVFSVLSSILTHDAQAQLATVDPESIVPLPCKFDMETPAPDVPPEMARFHGAWVGTWHDDRHILVVERVKPDGHASVVFAQADSAFYNMNREWWRDQATIADGVLTMTGFRTFRYAFDGQDRLYLTAALKSGGVTSGILVRTDAARLAAGDRPIDWPWPGERAWIPHLSVRTPDGARPILLEATFYPPAGPDPAPLAIFTHGSDVGRNQLRTWSFSTEAHWLRDNGFAVLAVMRRGRGRSEGINGEEDFGRDHEGSLIDVSAGIAQAIEDLESAIAFYGRPEFQSPKSIGNPNAIPIQISADPNDAEVQEIGAFLRVLNALENIRSSINVAERGRTMASEADAHDLHRRKGERGQRQCEDCGTPDSVESPI